MKRVFPDREAIDLSLSHPLFHDFDDLIEKPQVPNLALRLMSLNPANPNKRAYPLGINIEVHALSNYRAANRKLLSLICSPKGAMPAKGKIFLSLRALGAATNFLSHLGHQNCRHLTACFIVGCSRGRQVCPRARPFCLCHLVEEVMG
jgi:hypothetical protein